MFELAPWVLEFPLRNTFVLNARGDSSRLQAFISENGFQETADRIQPVRLYDPNLLPVPKHWRGTAEAWTRRRGIRTVLEHCLDRGIPHGMICDDSARLCTNWRVIFERFCRQLPNDWRLIVLGGAHCNLESGLPVKLSGSVYRPFAVESPTGVIWRTFTMLQKLYDFYLNEDTGIDDASDFTTLQERVSEFAYVPNEWLFRDGPVQATSGAVTGGAETLCELNWPQTVVAVLGFYRGGTSCVSGILHRLGVSMLDENNYSDGLNPDGYFECPKLHRLCNLFVDHPSMARLMPGSQIINLLRSWASRRSKLNFGRMAFGGKHPALCALGNEMIGAWPDRKFVVVDRDTESVVASLLKTGWGWTELEARNNVATLFGLREAFLQKCDSEEVFRIHYNQVLDSPIASVSAIGEFLNVELSDSLILDVARHIRLK